MGRTNWRALGIIVLCAAASGCIKSTILNGQIKGTRDGSVRTWTVLLAKSFGGAIPTNILYGHTGGATACQQAKAVVLYFVNPVTAGRRSLGGAG